MIELYLVWKPKIVSWIILSPPLEPIKSVYAWSTSKAKSAQDACLPSASPSHFIIIKVQAISTKYWKIITKAQAFQVQIQAISSKYQKIIMKVQAHQVLSILNGPRSKQPNFASFHIWFVTSWLSLEFVCLFHVSMFFWILKIHVAFDVLYSWIYVYILSKKKKKIKISKSFQKKRKNFKCLWTRGIRPLSHFQKKKKNSLN